MPTGHLATPFGELMELTDQAEAKEGSTGPKHYLRRRNGWGDAEEMGAAIERVLAEREAHEEVPTGAGNEEVPDQIFTGQGSNVRLLAGLVGLKLNPHPLQIGLFDILQSLRLPPR